MATDLAADSPEPRKPPVEGGKPHCTAEAPGGSSPGPWLDGDCSGACVPYCFPAVLLTGPLLWCAEEIHKPGGGADQMLFRWYIKVNHSLLNHCFIARASASFIKATILASLSVSTLTLVVILVALQRVTEEEHKAKEGSENLPKQDSSDVDAPNRVR